MATYIHLTHFDDLIATIKSDIDAAQAGIVDPGVDPSTSSAFWEWCWASDDAAELHFDNRFVTIATDVTTYKDKTFNDVTANSDVLVADNIYHLGDTDTRRAMNTDRMTDYCGGVSFIDMQEDDTQDVIYFGGNSNDVDLYALTNGATTLTPGLFVQGSDGKVAFGTNTPGTARVEILNSGNPQLRLTESASVNYTDFETDSDGMLSIKPSSGMIDLNNWNQRFNDWNMGIGQTCAGLRLFSNIAATSIHTDICVDTDGHAEIYSLDDIHIIPGATNVVAIGGGPASPTTNITQFNRSGTMRSWGDARQWEDMRATPADFSFAGVTDPTLASWTPGSGATLKAYEFAKGDEVFGIMQIPHNYAEGTDLKPHVHWTPGPYGAAEASATVSWVLNYTIAGVNEAFGTPATVNLYDNVSGTNHWHELSPSGTINGADLEISDIIAYRLFRDTTADTWSGAVTGQLPLLLEFDIHYQTDSIGSQNEGSK